MCKLQQRASSICAQHILTEISIRESIAEMAEELIIGIDFFFRTVSVL